LRRYRFGNLIAVEWRRGLGRLEIDGKPFRYVEKPASLCEDEAAEVVRQTNPDLANKKATEVHKRLLMPIVPAATTLVTPHQRPIPLSDATWNPRSDQCTQRAIEPELL